MNRFGVSKKPQTVLPKDDDPIRNYERKKRLDTQKGCGTSKKAPAPPIHEDNPDVGSSEMVSRSRARAPGNSRAPRRSRSVWSVMKDSEVQSMEPGPQTSEMAHSGLPQNDLSRIEIRTLRATRRSKSLVSIDVYKNDKNQDEIRISLIAWYLHFFGYNDLKHATYFIYKYEVLTAREYLMICKFVESQLGDDGWEGESDEEIIIRLIEFASDYNYPVQMTKKILIAPMAPAMKLRTSSFLLWLCSKAYNIKGRGRGRSANSENDRTKAFDGGIKEQIAHQFYINSYNKGEHMDMDKHKEEYRKHQSNLQIADVGKTEDLLRKRDRMDEVLSDGNKTLEVDFVKVAVTEESEATSQRIENLKQRIQKAINDAEKIKEKKKELIQQQIMLSREVRDLEEKQGRLPKIDEGKLEAIKKRIQKTDAGIKEQMGIQDRIKDLLELKTDLEEKLRLPCDEFTNNALPALNYILRKIGMPPIDLGPPNDHFERLMCENPDFANLFGILKVIEDILVTVERVITNQQNASSVSSDGNENEVLESFDASDSDSDVDDIPDDRSQQQAQALDSDLENDNMQAFEIGERRMISSLIEMEDGQNAEGADNEDEGVEPLYIALSRKQRRVQFEEDQQ